MSALRGGPLGSASQCPISATATCRRSPDIRRRQPKFLTMKSEVHIPGNGCLAMISPHGQVVQTYFFMSHLLPRLHEAACVRALRGPVPGFTASALKTSKLFGPKSPWRQSSSLVR
jgi:hypothetical protein